MQGNVWKQISEILIFFRFLSHPITKNAISQLQNGLKIQGNTINLIPNQFFALYCATYCQGTGFLVSAIGKVSKNGDFKEKC